MGSTANAFDGNENNYWHSDLVLDLTTPCQELDLDDEWISFSFGSTVLLTAYRPPIGLVKSVRPLSERPAVGPPARV